MKSYKQFLLSRIYRRFVKLCGTAGSANIRGMPGKQARRESCPLRASVQRLKPCQGLKSRPGCVSQAIWLPMPQIAYETYLGTIFRRKPVRAPKFLVPP